MKQRRECSPEQAAALVRPVDSIGIGMGTGQPLGFLHALGERSEFEQLTVYAAGFLGNLFPLFAKPGVRLISAFYGPAERLLRLAGHPVQYVPADFRRYGPILEAQAPRVMAACCAPPDARGRLSLSLHAGATFDELRRAGRDPQRLLIVETSPHLPRTRGVGSYEHALHVDEVDVLVHSDRAPVAVPESEPSAEERSIAEHLHPYIPEGATLQTGVGGAPSAIAQLLAQWSGGDYGIHSEVYTTSLMRLQRSGKVSNRKGSYDGLSIATFAIGSAELYAWLHERDDVAFLPVEQVNDPAVVARNRNMRSINSALAIDLFGQVAADALAGRQYSGTGGHEDFTGGANLAPGGRSFVCLPSTATVDGKLVSRISGRLPEGALVSTPRHQIDVVVTEHGAVELLGRTVEERAEALTSIAHPSFRDELRSAWAKLARR
jgi:acyl-CoA hydrolase